jgi:hypothetical protein
MISDEERKSRAAVLAQAKADEDGWNRRADHAQGGAARDQAKRPETPQWERRWPHDQPNGWNLDADKFLALIKSTDGMMWLALGKAKYIELRVDTRDCGFNLYDRDGEPLNPDEVVAAVEHVKKNYGAGCSSPAGCVDESFAQALADICDDLGCARDNEAALMAIKQLRDQVEDARKQVIEECARIVNQHYQPGHGCILRAVAAVRALSHPSTVRGPDPWSGRRSDTCEWPNCDQPSGGDICNERCLKQPPQVRTPISDAAGASTPVQQPRE